MSNTVEDRRIVANGLNEKFADIAEAIQKESRPEEIFIMLRRVQSSFAAIFPSMDEKEKSVVNTLLEKYEKQPEPLNILDAVAAIHFIMMKASLAYRGEIYLHQLRFYPVEG